MIKLLIGGSPCTHWSIAQSKNRETKAEGIGWELFENYVIAKEKFKPDFFLYENNWSASKEIKDQIQEELGYELMRINSRLVSAQNRDRFYVFNWSVEQPEDRGVLLKDVLESRIDFPPVQYTVQNSYDLKFSKGKMRQGNQKHSKQGTYVYFPDCEKSNAIIAGHAADEKVFQPLPACLRYERTQEAKRLRKAYECHEIHHGYHEFHELHPRADGKSNTLTTVQKDNRIIELAAPSNDAIYEVENGMITIKDKTYPIKLQDGYYIIRKLTPIECERLQTMPDNYTAAVSNTQRYKCLGNGWTAEVIIHILNGVLRDIPKNEKIVVLSMYDGIATGRYCLDKMGFTNVEYHAYEIDKYAIKVAMSNYPDIIHHGDAFQIRDSDWRM